MKILQIASAPVSYPGGTEKIILEISKKLSKKNEVTILQTTLYEPKKTTGTLYKEKIKIITCKNDYFLRGYGYSKEFVKKLEKIWEIYDVINIHGYGRFTSDFALKFLKNKKPLIFTADGFFHSKKAAFFKKIHNKIKGNLIKNAGLCTALTELEKKEYIRRGIKTDKIKVIPGGVDVNEFEVKASNALKKKHSNRKKILLYVGRIHETKGLRHVVRAIKDLDVTFLIAGKDEGYKKELEGLVEKLGIKNKVKFLGFIDDALLPKIFSIADIFILFSEWEGFGIVVIEAMAAGKPVIVSDRGSLPFIVKDEKEGFIVPFGNERLLKEKIKHLLENKVKAREMGTLGKKKAKGYNWENIANLYMDVYKTVRRNF